MERSESIYEAAALVVLFRRIRIFLASARTSEEFPDQLSDSGNSIISREPIVASEKCGGEWTSPCKPNAHNWSSQHQQNKLRAGDA